MVFEQTLIQLKQYKQSFGKIKSLSDSISIFRAIKNVELMPNNKFGRSTSMTKKTELSYVQGLNETVEIFNYF